MKPTAFALLLGVLLSGCDTVSETVAVPVQFANKTYTLEQSCYVAHKTYSRGSLPRVVLPPDPRQRKLPEVVSEDYVGLQIGSNFYPDVILGVLSKGMEFKIESIKLVTTDLKEESDFNSIYRVSGNLIIRPAGAIHQQWPLIEAPWWIVGRPDAEQLSLMFDKDP